MVFMGKERRRRRRFAVQWDGSLAVEFPDLRETQPVRVKDFSALGVRFFMPRVYFRGRYLLSGLRPGRLLLRMNVPDASPDSPLVQRISVRWYRWSVPENAFEIAAQFIEVPPAVQRRLDALSDRLRRQRELPAGSLFHRILVLTSG
jgi:hypothetical protein